MRKGTRPRKNLAQMMTIEYPQVFHTGIVPEGTDKKLALAWALQAWGNASMGMPIPPNFGNGLVAIGALWPGESMTGDGCLALSKRLRAESIPAENITTILDAVKLDLDSILQKVANMSGIGIDIRDRANAAITKIEVFKEKQAV